MKTIDSLISFKNPIGTQIPNINLYMDQLLEYFDHTLGDLKRQNEDAVFTKTMVNNYVKSNLINAPDKKKYSHETICDLVLVYHLKRAFSIPDTTIILNAIKNDPEYYESFIKIQGAIRESLLEVIPKSLTKESAKEMLTHLSAEISIKKQLAEQLIDYLSSDIDVQK
ncbi:DUF1836 domain-containing protein [Fusibacter bizertensis]|uniref:DUF1836 domain-containing protein n=1 Tax=Fusibacter bizertensis TaxID=1488331 RepID=A0ABT6NDJ0_9FIRM|nr:DUF1836 domain-containing protein [Fusibacter bizertensis]MDH8678499.1 DUF1836 domain-containing protein [Fusibacter bizertensis]